MGLHFVFGGNIKGLARDIRSYRGAWNEHFTSIVCSGFSMSEHCWKLHGVFLNGSMVLSRLVVRPSEMARHSFLKCWRLLKLRAQVFPQVVVSIFAFDFQIDRPVSQEPSNVPQKVHMNSYVPSP